MNWLKFLGYIMCARCKRSFLPKEMKKGTKPLLCIPCWELVERAALRTC